MNSFRILPNSSSQGRTQRSFGSIQTRNGTRVQALSHLRPLDYTFEVTFSLGGNSKEEQSGGGDGGPKDPDDSTHAALETAKAKGEPPAARTKKVLKNFVESSVLPQDRPMFRTQLRAIYDVLDRFTGERMFGGSIEARILTLREQNKDDIDKVISLVLSHIKVSSKAKLVLTILNHIKTKGISVSNAESPLYKVLQDLASLEAKSSTSVSLKAREVLIMGQMPSYEERLGQMETVLRSSVTSQYYGEQVNTVHTPSAEVLRELSDSRYTVFDVLSAFFEHEDHMVPVAAFEVYIRRAYKGNTLLSIDYEEGDELDDGDSPSIVTWRFNLGQSHSPPPTPRISLSGSASVSDLTYLISRHQSQPIRSPPNVLNVALRLFREEDDMPEDAWFEKLTAFVNEQSSTLREHGVGCVSIILCCPSQYPVYLTLREVDRVWTEEQFIHNIGPALAFQLELSRLSSYVESKQIHIYHAVARENQLDNKFFVRALVQPVTTVLDALELVTAEPRNTNCFIERHGKRLWRLHVTGSEIRIALEDDEGNVTPIRCVIENVSGFIDNYHGYQELTTDKGTTILTSIGEKGPLHLQPVHQAYSSKESLQPKRYQAHLISTTYIYDFPDLFSKALQNLWDNTRATNPTLVKPRVLLESKELVLDEHDQLAEVDSTRQQHFWNDRLGIHYAYSRIPSRSQSCSRSKRHHLQNWIIRSHGRPILLSCSVRELGRPRIYLSANSGARIGLAEELIPLFSAAWNEEGHPEKGRSKAMIPSKPSMLRWQESRALTGAGALNKVLGREVYTSNLQLGGTQIGVSHLMASSDLEGATHILKWLSYVPEVKDGALLVLESSGSWDRDIGYTPPKGAYDPRWFIEGKTDEATSEWMSGFFDKGSFQETLSGWAQTVVVGRARLGGIPMGVIAVETRTIERIIPADPANPASFEQCIMVGLGTANSSTSDGEILACEQ
ncbi:acetyl-CoA carboxylase [Lentinula edodes]|nr:acetyl-CoA carboxylase [Lentinula edodes]